MKRFGTTEPAAARSLEVMTRLRELAQPLEDDSDLDPLLARIGDARYVLLGEASHGTHEFYDWRARLSRRLIEEKGFSFVAVEGDWPDCERLNAYSNGRAPESSAREVLLRLKRWPTWMWANEEVAELAEWMREHNLRRAPEARVGFYGLDVYSLWDSMEAVVRYLERADPGAAARARCAYECFAPFEGEPEQYAYATALAPTTCEDAVVRALVELQQQRVPAAGTERESFFFAEQNAIVAKNAERYYRTMVQSGSRSWNVRDEHMLECLERIVGFHGPASKAIVWAHNTHIGDARYTDMRQAGEINLGQLVRERCAEDGVVLVGFSTHHGSVIAGDEWGAPYRSMLVPAARADSFEDLLHRAGLRSALLCFDPEQSEAALLEPRGHRAIGVVYRPQFEHLGNYVPTVLPRRYDALLHFDVTRALDPLQPADAAAEPLEPAETYPFGV